MTMKKILKKILNVKYIKIICQNFDEVTATYYIYVDITKGQKMKCPICGKKCKGYDTTTLKRKWRTLDFGSAKTYLVADVHRICCPEHGIHTEAVPWAEHCSRFTKEFEQQVAYLALNVSKKQVAEQMRIAWNTVGPIISRVKNKLEPNSKARFEGMTRIGIDETSYKKGHKYMTIVVDHDANQVVWLGENHGKEVLSKFMNVLSEAQRKQIELVSADGAKWIQSCIDVYLPNAEKCIDHFHVISWAIEAMDESRKEIWRESKKMDKQAPKRKRGRPKKGEIVEEKQSVHIKSMKYPLGKNPEHLSEKQQSVLKDIKKVYPKLFRAYMLKESLRAVFRSSPDKVERELKVWLSWACRCRIPAFVELSKKIRRNKAGILATIRHGLSNARIESMNNKIKLIIRKSYGFRNIQNLFDMVMIACSKLVEKIKPAYALR